MARVHYSMVFELLAKTSSLQIVTWHPTDAPGVANSPEEYQDKQEDEKDLKSRRNECFHSTRLDLFNWQNNGLSVMTVNFATGPLLILLVPDPHLNPNFNSWCLA